MSFVACGGRYDASDVDVGAGGRDGTATGAASGSGSGGSGQATSGAATGSDGATGGGASGDDGATSDGGTGPGGEAGNGDDDDRCGSPTDPKNCGRCGHDCTTLPYVDPDGVRCVDGECSYDDGACLPGFAHCSGDADQGCSNDLTRPSRCGDCARSCSGSTPLCASPPSETASCVDACPAGLVRCGNQCVSLESNAGHCGACDNACRVSNGVGICVAGQCVPAGCFSGYADCYPAQPGCETFLETFDHCARCGDSCAASHASGRCEAGVCVRECDAGFANCDRSRPDCEARLDAAGHCGGCGVECPSERPLCSAGTCVALCTVPLEECAGACVDLETNSAHCGACGSACESYQACEAGRCTPRYLGTALIENDQFTVPSVAVHTDGSFAISYGLNGSVDLDPGSGSDVRSSNGGEDVAVIRFDASGGYLWARVVGGPDNDWSGRIAMGPDGSVVETFDFRGTVDFDPGPGVVSHGASALGENAVIGFGTDGAFRWVARFAALGTNAFSDGGAVSVDAKGGVYVAGRFGGTVDLDPGPGSLTASAVGNGRYLVKLNQDGELVWTLTFPDCALGIVALEVDANDTLWVGGSFGGSCDLDPGAGSAPATATGDSDSVVLRFDAENGAYLGHHVESLAANESIGSSAFSDGARYFGGTLDAPDYRVTAFVLKANATGDKQWLVTAENRTGRIAPARGGGVVAAGMGSRSAGPVSQGVSLLGLDATGDQRWAIDLASRNSGAYDIASTDAGFVVVGVLSEYGIDFDPGAASDVASGPGVFISRYAFE